MGDLLAHYFSLSGRTRRREYWFHELALLLTGLVLGWTGSGAAGSGLFDILGFFASLVMVWYSLAISVRRFHDIGKSGWYMLIFVIPLGVFAVLYFFAQPGEKGDNKYGPDPNAAVTGLDEAGGDLGDGGGGLV